MDIDVMPSEYLEGYKYRLDVIDHASSWLWKSLLETKGDARTHMEHLINSLKPDLRPVGVLGAKKFPTNPIKNLWYTSRIQWKRS
jgi:hypothetical protein